MPAVKKRVNPKAPGLDEKTRMRRRALKKLQQMSADDLFKLAVSAGIYTKGGKLTKHYRADAEPSANRPTE
jgi:hypothetical protein